MRACCLQSLERFLIKTPSMTASWGAATSLLISAIRICKLVRILETLRVSKRHEVASWEYPGRCALLSPRSSCCLRHRHRHRHRKLEIAIPLVITCAPGGGDVSNIDSSLAILDAQPPQNLNQKVAHKLADQNCCFYLASQISTEFRRSSPQSIWHSAWHML